MTRLRCALLYGRLRSFGLRFYGVFSKWGARQPIGTRLLAFLLPTSAGLLFGFVLWVFFPGLPALYATTLAVTMLYVALTGSAFLRGPGPARIESALRTLADEHGSMLRELALAKEGAARYRAAARQAKAEALKAQHATHRLREEVKRADLIGQKAQQASRPRGLEICGTCGKDVAAEAETCPHCGAKGPSSKRTASMVAIGCGVIALIVIGTCVLSVGTPSSGRGPASTPRRQAPSLNASVSFTGTQFVIANRDSFDWTDVRLEINPGVLTSGYSLTADRIVAGETYAVGAMQFAKGDGTRFDPFAMKPLQLSVSAETPWGRGYWLGGWK
jgi:hypothetical protein